MTTQMEMDPPRPRGSRRRGILVALAMVLAFGAGAGAMAVAHRFQPAITLLPLTPGPVAAMSTWSPVAVKGQVAEVFGNKFILQDDSGRALIETGRRGEWGHLVAKDETVTVQGRFENGFVHAAAVVHANGRTDVLLPPGPPGMAAWFGGPWRHWFGA